MSKQTTKPAALVISADFAATVGAGIASADTSLFSMSNFTTGYMLDAGGVAAKKGQEGKCGEGKCGERKDKGVEGSCGEAKDAEGSCGGKK